MHKLRSYLSLLGIVVAVTTLVSVMSVVNGLDLYVTDHVANLGANAFHRRSLWHHHQRAGPGESAAPPTAPTAARG